MLQSLSIRNVVLIEKLDLSFDSGLCVLTGETGAGKSILLDALGLALGGRGDSKLVRPGADKASVTAEFHVPPAHPALAFLQDQDLDLEDEHLILRRIVGADGRSRAFINDQPVSASLLRSLGEHLIEVQGQMEQRGLLDPVNHRAILDAYGQLSERVESVAVGWNGWRTAKNDLDELEQRLEESRRDEELLRHYLRELEQFAPEADEEEVLAARRSLLMNSEALAQAINEAQVALEDGGNDEPSAATALVEAHRVLERVSPKAAGLLDSVLETLDRAKAEIEEACDQLYAVARDMDFGENDLESVSDRYFTLLDLARKHDCASADLPRVLDDIRRRLDSIDRGDSELSELRRKADDAQETYRKAAEALAKARQKAAAKLNKAVNVELPPLKLEKASFHCKLDRLPASSWSAAGMDRVVFEVATNPGATPGPISKIASGGELSRFLLALKVILAAVNPERVLVFDEVDSGIGGATAHAVGERLERLAKDRQILVVTHSPQVAARGTHHWTVIKRATRNTAETQVSQLDDQARREEIARMLSGAEITKEARAAAERLMGAG